MSSPPLKLVLHITCGGPGSIRSRFKCALFPTPPDAIRRPQSDLLWAFIQDRFSFVQLKGSRYVIKKDRRVSTQSGAEFIDFGSNASIVEVNSHGLFRHQSWMYFNKVSNQIGPLNFSIWRGGVERWWHCNHTPYAADWTSSHCDKASSTYVVKIVIFLPTISTTLWEIPD